MIHWQHKKSPSFLIQKFKATHTHAPTCTRMHAQEHLGTCGHVNCPLPCHTHNTPNSADAVKLLNNSQPHKNDLEDIWRD